MTGAPFRVMLRMQIRPGAEEDFERVWLEVGDSVTSHPANLGQWLSRSQDEPGVYYIISDWVDEPRFREFETSERHLEHRTKLHPFRSGGSMVTQQVVAHLPGAGAGTADGRAPVDEVRVLLHHRSTDHAGVAEAYRRVSERLAGVPGHLGDELLRPTHDPEGFVVLSRWSGLGAFERWERGPDHRASTADLRDYRDTSNGRPFAVYVVADAHAP